MSKRKAVVRLLNQSIYSDATLNSLPYPLLVEAEICSILTNHATVTESAVKKMLGSDSWTGGLTWFNQMFDRDDLGKSWEEVELNPFTAWNNLKSSRDVGAMPATLNVIR